jgi:hypothetical protein
VRVRALAHNGWLTAGAAIAAGLAVAFVQFLLLVQKSPLLRYPAVLLFSLAWVGGLWLELTAPPPRLAHHSRRPGTCRGPGHLRRPADGPGLAAGRRAAGHHHRGPAVCRRGLPHRRLRLLAVRQGHRSPRGAGPRGHRDRSPWNRAERDLVRPGGLVAGPGHVVLAVAEGISIIGIPFAIKDLQLAYIALAPIGRDVVRR